MPKYTDGPLGITIHPRFRGGMNTWVSIANTRHSKTGNAGFYNRGGAIGDNAHHRHPRAAKCAVRLAYWIETMWRLWKVTRKPARVECPHCYLGVIVDEGRMCPECDGTGWLPPFHGFVFYGPRGIR